MRRRALAAACSAAILIADLLLSQYRRHGKPVQASSIYRRLAVNRIRKEIERMADFANETPEKAQPSGRSRIEIRAARIAVDYFVIATIYLLAGMTALPWLTPRMLDYFYQPLILALVHTFTIGWITAAIIGVLYRYAPALGHKPLPYPRLLAPQLILFLIGSSGVISHFALGSWSGVWSAAIVLIASLILFGVNIVPCVWAGVGRGIAQTGVLFAVCFLLTAATLGFLLALDKSVGIIGGNLLDNLAAHANLAAIGWIAITVCALSYRMLPAFIGAEAINFDGRRWLVYALGGSAIMLATALLFASKAIIISAATLAALPIVIFVVSIFAMLPGRRPMPGWTAPHVAAGAGWAMVAVASGLALPPLDGDSMIAARVAVIYGAAGLLGWFGNFIIGMSYHLFPGAVAHARSVRGRSAMKFADIESPSGRWLIFASYNAGLLLLGADALASRLLPATIGEILTALGGVAYSLATLRTLSFAYRR